MIEEKQKAAQKRFENVFQNEKVYYERQTKDDEHLRMILDSLYISDGTKIIDLGTGTGYIAFTLAEKSKKVEVIGVDILEDTLYVNNKKAISQNIKNIKFIEYNGIEMPFEDNSVDVIVSRYSLHHFVDIKKSFLEISRILKPGGQLFISDPTPNEDDTERFVDVFMKLCEDGHNMFYKKEELVDFAEKVDMKLDRYFMTEIRFPSGQRTEGYRRIQHKVSDNIKKDYNIEIINDEVWITERVLNISFIKQSL